MTKFRNKQLKGLQSKYLLTGSILGFIIAATPYIFYLYEIFPDGPVWENSFFTYESKYYKSVLAAAWTYLGKLVPLILLLIWFFTCKHWWYHAILVPLIMYSYQIVTIFYEDVFLQVDLMDTNQLIYQAPLFLMVLVTLYLVRVKIFDRIYGIDLSELDETNISVFNSMSTNEEKELEFFRKTNPFSSPEPTEEYYRKL